MSGNQTELVETLQVEAGVLRMALADMREWLVALDAQARIRAIERVLASDAGRRTMRDLQLAKNTLRRILEWAGEIKATNPEQLDSYEAHRAAVVITHLAASVLEVMNGNGSCYEIESDVFEALMKKERMQTG